MYVVIFEVETKPAGQEAYLKIAAELRRDLERQEGFISIERFQSLVNEGKLLSLSFWASEEAIKNWRRHLDHRKAQQIGRQELFSDYRIRVAEVVRAYGLHNRAQVPEDIA